MKASTDNKILTSSDYERFSFHGQQRPIRAAHVRRIAGSMRKHGFIPSYPISVYRDGNNFRIIDGHHRFEAAKLLKIPVYFVMLERRFSSAVGDGNLGRPWSLMEWVSKYSQDGLKDYITLRAYIANGVPGTIAVGMLYGHSGKSNASELIPTGQFKVKETSRIDAIVGLMKEFEASPVVKSRHFIEAVSLFLRVGDFDLKQLRARLSSNLLSLKKTASREQMLDQLERIYNFHSARKINLAWLAKEAAKNRACVQLTAQPAPKVRKGWAADISLSRTA